MGMYHYEAIDSKGKKIIGSLSAEDKTRVEIFLKSKGYRPVLIEGSSSNPQIKSHVTSHPPLRLSRKSHALFFRSLATTLKSGMNPRAALHVIMQNAPNNTIRNLTKMLIPVVEQGGHLSDAMKQYPLAFDEWELGMIKAGELGGFLDEVCTKIAGRNESHVTFFEFFCNLLWLCLASNVFLLVLIIPFFKILFNAAAQGMTNPGIAYLQQAITSLIPQAIVWTTPVVILKIVMITQREKRWYQNIANRVWMVSSRYRVAALAEFSEMLNRLLLAGISPLVAWEAAAGSLRSLAFRIPLLKGTDVIKQGKGITEALRYSGLAEQEELGQLAIAERAGRITDALQHVTGDYRDQEKTIGNRLGSIRLHALLIGNIVLFGIGCIFCAYYYREGLFHYIDTFTNGQ